MTKAAIKQAFEVVTARQVANAVDCDRRTVRTVRDQGRVARTVAGRAIAKAMAAMSGVPVSAILAPDDDGPSVGVLERETPDAPDPTESVKPDEYTALAEKRIEDWKIAKLNRIAKERENAVAAHSASRAPFFASRSHPAIEHVSHSPSAFSFTWRRALCTLPRDWA